MFRLLTISGLILLGLIIILVGTWGALALFHVTPFNESGRYALAISFGLVALTSLIMLGFHRWRWRALALHGLLFAVVIGWFVSVEPSNTREWQEDVALLPYAVQEENNITIHNIRNFNYRSETDYTPAYYDKTYDLSKLIGVDIISVYWMGPAVAHVFVSFAFSDGEHLAISIETRKEKGEAYSTIKGFFRQYELYYVVADERDVIGLRTNYRFNPIEDVYIYPTTGTLQEARSLFLTYIEKMNELKKQPEFYNTLTTNCTTNIWLNASGKIEHIPLSWKILASGYVPEYLYETGHLRTDGLTFEELQKRSHINKRALSSEVNEDFSSRIRDHEGTSVPNR